MGNSKVYGGGMYVLPEAEIDDGRLDVMFVKDASQAPPPRPAAHASSRARTRTSELVEFLRGEEIEVSSDRPFAIYADGDPIGATPAIMRVERRCLQGHRAVLMFRVARALARLARAASRRVGRTGGTTAPGRMLLKLSPGSLRRMAGELDAGSVLVSATNGKTTTAAMIAAALERAGRPVVHNRAGSNMAWGVATALLDAGRERGQIGLFEVDEAWLPAVARDTAPRLLLLSNLFRDQLDRYGELELLADRWAELTADLDGRARFVLNADDPLVADLGRDRAGVTYFGVEDDSQALPGMQHAADSKHCRNCGHAYEYEAVYLGHMGRYHCPNCGRTRPGAAGRGDEREARRHDAARAWSSARPQGEPRARSQAPRPLQRLQRGGGGGDRARARRAARHRRRGARGLRRRVRAGGDDPGRRPPAYRSS